MTKVVAVCGPSTPNSVLIVKLSVSPAAMEFKTFAGKKNKSPVSSSKARGMNLFPSVMTPKAVSYTHLTLPTTPYV